MKRAVHFTVELPRYLIIVSMQRFALAVGENQKMCRREVEIILRHFDAEGF